MLVPANSTTGLTRMSNPPEIFTGNFTQQESIPDDAIAAAVEVMRSGRLHRYNTAPGEDAPTALLEQEFAAYVGAEYCLACASGGYALTTALRAVGVTPGETVLTNAFTLAPVPGAIAGAGGVPVFVGVTDQLVIDLDDLDRKARETGAKWLLLSHMRGHICDMDALMDLCDGLGLGVVEDCAHTMGARWKGRLSGTHGVAACFSTQTYKHMNSGEGGLLTSNDKEVMARAVMLSGSYMLYDRHLAAPLPADFEAVKMVTPNCSGRMDNLRAAILRPQLRALDDQCAAWTQRYRATEAQLENSPGIDVIARPEGEDFVGSSIQFLLDERIADRAPDVVARCMARGVELKWFGAAAPAGFTSRYDSWQYAPTQSLPQTDAILGRVMDMRIPLTFSLQDCSDLGAIIAAEVGAVFQAR